MNAVQISVIIVNYNVRPFLEHALASVTKALGGLSGEVLVVDNASDDGSVDMLREKFPGVKLIVNENNVGFARANNQAARESLGEYLLFLNPDTVVQENTLRVMMDFFGQHPEAGLAGCKILNPDGTLQLACRRSFPTPWVAFTKIVGLAAMFPRSRMFARYNLTFRNPDETCQVDAVSGSFLFARRSVFENVGGFDEDFFMYGEDLDFCYRVKKNGLKVYYVHSTQIIHYKGESVRRSDIDDVKLFYEAMRIFVRKNISRRWLTDLILRTGIALREWIAFLVKIAKSLRAAALDLFLVIVSVFLAAWLRFGEWFRFPASAYPVVTTIPALVVLSSMYALGVYTTRKLSISRAASSVFIGYIMLSALTFFFNQFAYSRLIVLVSGCVSIVALPGWRLMVKMRSRSMGAHRRSLFGRGALIVGADASGQEVLRKLRTRPSGGYNVIGFIDVNRKRIGEKIAGVEILGSIDNIRKVIQEQKVSEVIFSTHTLPYTDILSVIERTKNRSVNFRMVPDSLNVIIGKTHIDELNDIPLVDIEYNIHKPANRFVKRLFDVVGSAFLLMVLYPFVRARQSPGKSPGPFGSNVLALPKVLRGEMSLVGMSDDVPPASRNGSVVPREHLERVGITGLAQLHMHNDLTPEEIERYNLYYAKNQSLFLDLQILLKTISLIARH